MRAGNHDRRLDALEAASATAGTKTFIDVVREALAVPLYKIPIPEEYTPTWLEGLDPELVRRVRACDDEQAYLQATAESRRRWRAQAAGAPPPPDPEPPPPQWFPDQHAAIKAAAAAGALPQPPAPPPPAGNHAIGAAPLSQNLPFNPCEQGRDREFAQQRYSESEIEEYRASWLERARR
jgi:hypothetical protein